MTQENKDLLIKDLCARLPYNVKIQYEDDIFTIDYISATYEEVKLNTPNNYTIDVLEVKPYLFPMSNMTEEQKEEYADLQQRVIYNGKGVVNLDVAKYVDWCYKHHIDINNLIPIGLAIDATNLNIY